MVKVRSMEEVLLVFGSIFKIAEVDISQREVGVAVSTKPRLYAEKVMKQQGGMSKKSKQRVKILALARDLSITQVLATTGPVDHRGQTKLRGSRTNP